jgi:hypothetical protein
LKATSPAETGLAGAAFLHLQVCAEWLLPVESRYREILIWREIGSFCAKKEKH